MAHELPFDIEIPMTAFEKASAPPGQQRRIGGIASIETKDRQDEVVLARGLDFSDFLQNGWINDNHSKDTDGVVGYPDPESHRMFKKGEQLPSGEVAPAAGHWIEGYMLEGHDRADRIWSLANSLKKTKRKLGLSVEGKVLKRGGFHKSGGKLVAKAKVRNVAVTNCPVNTVAKMDVLAKSLQVVEASEPDEIDKALSMGTATGINPPAGPQTGEGAGQVLTGQSLEQKDKPPRVVESGKDTDDDEDKKDKKDKKTKKGKSLSLTKAFAWARKRLPHASDSQVWRFLELTKKLKTQSRL